MRPLTIKNWQNFDFLIFVKDFTKINSRKGKQAGKQEYIAMFYIFKMFPFKYMNVFILTNKKVWHDEIYPKMKTKI